MEYITFDNIQAVLSVIGVVATVVSPFAVPYITGTKKILKEVSNYVETSEKDNVDVFKEMRSRGYSNLSRHINETLEPHLNYNSL